MYIFMELAIHGSVNCGWPNRNFSGDWCKTVITPLQRPWSYCSCALSLWYNVDPSLYYSQIVMVVLWIADELNHTTVLYDALLQKRYNNGICSKQTLDMRCIFRIIEQIISLQCSFSLIKVCLHVIIGYMINTIILWKKHGHNLHQLETVISCLGEMEVFE